MVCFVALYQLVFQMEPVCTGLGTYVFEFITDLIMSYSHYRKCCYN